VAKKIYPSPYSPPSPEQLERARSIAVRALVFTLDPSGKTGPQLIHETDPEFKKLREPLCPVYPGVELAERPLGSLIGLLPPGDLATAFGSLERAVSEGQSMRHGGTILYGLQISASRYGSSELAELLVRNAAVVRILFQYNSWMVRLVPVDRLDAVLMSLTENWRPGRDVVIWSILESHDQWSPQLSRRILDAILNAGSEPRHLFFTWGGNGVADNIHPSVIPEALVTLKPWTAKQANAKRWMRKLKTRQKSLAAG
jgi:hypothetical protein